MDDGLTAVELSLLAVALGTDAFSVAVGVGTEGVSPRRMFRLSWHFGLFQFLMPLIGWLLGRQLVVLVGSIGHWIVAAFLIYVGVRMVLESVRGEGGSEFVGVDRTKGFQLVMFSVATSLDALGVGVALGLLEYAIVFPAIVIGLVAGGMTALGMLIGDRLRRVIGRKAEIVGGVVLIGLGIRFLVT